MGEILWGGILDGERARKVAQTDKVNSHIIQMWYLAVICWDRERVWGDTSAHTQLSNALNPGREFVNSSDMKAINASH